MVYIVLIFAEQGGVLTAMCPCTFPRRSIPRSLPLSVHTTNIFRKGDNKFKELSRKVYHVGLALESVKEALIRVVRARTRERERGETGVTW